MIKTRNTFWKTWYLPHSQVHNDRTVPIIMAGCVHETALFPPPLLNLTLPSCSSTPISYSRENVGDLRTFKAEV